MPFDMSDGALKSLSRCEVCGHYEKGDLYVIGWRVWKIIPRVRVMVLCDDHADVYRLRGYEVKVTPKVTGLKEAADKLKQEKDERKEAQADAALFVAEAADRAFNRLPKAKRNDVTGLKIRELISALRWSHQTKRGL